MSELQDHSQVSTTHSYGVKCIPFLFPKSGEFEHVLTCFKDPKAIESLNNYLYLVGNSIELLAWAFKDFPNKLGTKKDDTTEKVKCLVEFQSIF